MHDTDWMKTGYIPNVIPYHAFFPLNLLKYIEQKQQLVSNKCHTGKSLMSLN